MPTYRAYKRDSGFYIRSNINGSFITLQVSSTAEKFLRGLSYGDEDSLSWHLIIPLMQQGHITTGEAGPSEQEVEADVDTSQSANLNPDERTALQEFLSAPNSSPSPSEKAVAAIQRLGPTLSTSDIQECWEAAHDTEAFTASVTTMADQHPMQVEGFGVNQGHPAYLFSTRGIRWKAFESFRDSESDNEWVIYTRPSQAGDSQLLRLQQGRLTRWKVYSDTSSGAQRADLAALLPDILYLLDRYPGYTPVPGDWEINAATAAHEITKAEQIWATQLFERVCSQYTRSDRSATATQGTIAAIDEAGNGRIHTDGGFAVTFSPQANPDAPAELTYDTLLQLDVVAAGSDWIAKNTIEWDGASTSQSHDSDVSEYERGEIVYLNHESGYGNISRTGCHKNIYFRATLLPRSLTIGDVVFCRHRDGIATKIVNAAPRDSDHQVLIDGQRDAGFILYATDDYGAVYSNKNGVAVLFQSSDPHLIQATPGTGFRYVITEQSEGVFRATHLERSAAHDQSQELARELQTKGDTEQLPESGGLRSTAAAIVQQHSSDPDRFFEQSRMYEDLGDLPVALDETLLAIGRPLEDSLIDIELSRAGNPVFHLTDAEPEVEVTVEPNRSVPGLVAVRVIPEEGPIHQATILDGEFIRWQPQTDSALPTEERDQFIRSQGGYVTLVVALLVHTDILR